MASRDRPYRGILLPALALCLGMHVPIARALTLEVGIYDQKPDVYIARDGRPAGILGELLNEIARQEGFAEPGERIVITAGVPLGTTGATNMLRVAFVEEGH